AARGQLDRQLLPDLLRGDLDRHPELIRGPQQLLHVELGETLQRLGRYHRRRQARVLQEEQAVGLVGVQAADLELAVADEDRAHGVLEARPMAAYEHHGAGNRFVVRPDEAPLDRHAATEGDVDLLHLLVFLHLHVEDSVVIGRVANGLVTDATGAADGLRNVLPRWVRHDEAAAAHRRADLVRAVRFTGDAVVVASVAGDAGAGHRQAGARLRHLAAGHGAARQGQFDGAPHPALWGVHRP